MATLSILSKDEVTQMVVSRDSGPGMRASCHDLCTTLSSPRLPKHPAALFLYPLVHLFLHTFIRHTPEHELRYGTKYWDQATDGAWCFSALDVAYCGGTVSPQIIC